MGRRAALGVFVRSCIELAFLTAPILAFFLTECSGETCARSCIRVGLWAQTQYSVVDVVSDRVQQPMFWHTSCARPDFTCKETQWLSMYRQSETRVGKHRRHTRTRNASLPTQANNTARGARKQPPNQRTIHAASEDTTHHTTPRATIAPGADTLARHPPRARPVLCCDLQCLTCQCNILQSRARQYYPVPLDSSSDDETSGEQPPQTHRK